MHAHPHRHYVSTARPGPCRRPSRYGLPSGKGSSSILRSSCVNHSVTWHRVPDLRAGEERGCRGGCRGVQRGVQRGCRGGAAPVAVGTPFDDGPCPAHLLEEGLAAAAALAAAPAAALAAAAARGCGAARDVGVEGAEGRVHRGQVLQGERVLLGQPVDVPCSGAGLGLAQGLGVGLGPGFGQDSGRVRVRVSVRAGARARVPMAASVKRKLGQVSRASFWCSILLK